MSNNHVVSDHAVLRWLEQFGFVDVEAVRATIHMETREALNSGASSLAINGARYTFRNGYVTTVTNERKPCRRLKWGASK